MVAIDIVKLILLFVVEVLASYTDLKNNNIKNRLLLISGISGVIFAVVEYAVLQKTNLLPFLISVGAVLFISVILYVFHIWAGGDCKLLWVISILYPVDFYWEIDIGYFPFIYCIAIMFIIGFLFLLGESVLLLFKRRKDFSLVNLLQEFKKALFSYLRTIIFLAALNHIYVTYISQLLVIPSSIYACICIGYVMLINSFSFMKKWWMVLVFGVFDFGMFLLTNNIGINTLWWSYVVVVAFMLLRLFISQFNYDEIPTHNVKKGMVLSVGTSLRMQNSRVKGMPGVSDETLKSRLSESEAESISRWEKSQNGTSSIVIVRKIPFAIFMLIGTIIYYLLGELIF